MASLGRNGCDLARLIANRTGQVGARLGIALITASLASGLSGCSESGIVGRSVALRQTPTSDSIILATIPTGSAVEVKNCTNGWCHVGWQGRDGYILAKTLRAKASPDTDQADEDDFAAPDTSGEGAPM
jgi:uncharacterized protein YraI